MLLESHTTRGYSMVASSSAESWRLLCMSDDAISLPTGRGQGTLHESTSSYHRRSQTD